jgi:hypothetical protein
MGSIAANRDLTLGVMLEALGAWCGLALFAALALIGLRPPDSIPVNSSPAKFSAERAMVHIRMIANRPHPIGTAANECVRDYLQGQLSVLGLDPEIFTAIGVSTDPHSVVIGHTHDIIGRLPGTASTGAILLSAHYDSVSNGPGAADDGAAIGAILEAVRAIEVSPRLKNDLIVLFTDGEEEGLLGAEAFAVSHPWVKNVRLVLNFEARGNSGPSVLFETTANNSKLVQEVASTGIPIVGSSVFNVLYKKLLPNSTDFAVLGRPEVSGLNFAFGAGLEAYHSRLDTIRDLNVASVQEHGTYALYLARHFGQIDLVHLRQRTGNQVFFDWFGSRLVTYPEQFIIPLQVAVTLLIILAIRLVVRRAHTGRRIVLASFWIAAELGLNAVICYGLWQSLSHLLKGRLLLVDCVPTAVLLVGVVVLFTALHASLLRNIIQHFSDDVAHVAGLMLICLCAWALAIFVPSGSYLLYWPLVFAALGVIASLSLKQTSENTRTLAALPAVLAAILLFVPFLYILYVFATPQAVVLVAMSLLSGTFLLFSMPLMHILAPRGDGWRWALVILVGTGIAAVAVGIKLSHHDADHPSHDSMLYCLDANSGRALWISLDPSLDSWTSTFFHNSLDNKHAVPQHLAGSFQPVFSAPATPLRLLAPVAQIDGRNFDLVAADDNPIREDTKTAREPNNTLHITVKSQRNAWVLYLRFPPDFQVSAIKIAEREIQVKRTDRAVGVYLYGMGQQEVSLQLTCRAVTGVPLWIMDESVGLPPFAGSRPPNVTGWPSSDVSIVSRQYRLVAK